MSSVTRSFSDPDLIPDKEVTAKDDHLVPKDLRCWGNRVINEQSGRTTHRACRGGRHLEVV